MSIPILATKLYIPPRRSEVVSRPHLLARLDTGLVAGCKLTLISAPAGFGKTTLLGEWASQRIGESASERSIAWVSLDTGDSHPLGFLAYLVAAVQTVAPDFGASVVGVLQSPQPPPIEMLLTMLLNDIAAIPQPLILILDDYHVLDSLSVDEALSFLLDHLPPQLHLVIASREDPNLPLSRLRARGQLTELRAADLRFTPAEAADFLNGVMGLNLAEADITGLEARTEGWIAGLQLAALSLQGQKEPARFIQSFSGSHRFILDYLLDEVLHKQSEAVQTFLLRTAILNRLCGPLCDAVLGKEAGSKTQEAGSSVSCVLPPASCILESLDRANLFIVPLDNERRWYRYHHLFRDLLRQRLAQSLPPDALPAYHLRASVWYAAHGDQAEAFHHAVAAGDWARAADLAEAAWAATFRSYIQNTLFLGWMKALPDALIRARPVLSAGYAWALLDVGALEAAEAWLRDAERGLAAPEAARIVVDEAEFRALPATIAIARAYLALARRDMAAIIPLAHHALALIPAADHFRRAGVIALLGLMHLSGGDLDAAAASMVEGMDMTHTAGSTAIALTGVFPLADIRLVQGRLCEAEKVFVQALESAKAQDTAEAPGVADLYLGLSQIYLERGDWGAAGQHLETGAALDVQARSPDWAYHDSLARARFQAAVGDLDGALDLFNQAERLYHTPMLPDLHPLTALKARIWVRQGQLDKTQTWAQEMGLSATDALSFLREFEHITLARVLLARYRRERADAVLAEVLGLLERLWQAATAGRRCGNSIEILILQALAHQARGDVSRALPLLERALNLAEPEGYVRIFVDEGAPLAHLLSAAATRGSAPDYIARLLAAFPDFATNATTPSKIQNPTLVVSKANPSKMVEPLSQRELEILRLVAQGLSNREIGKKLFLALDTVKGHNRRIYGKLQVQRRTEAIARARELGLL